MMGRGGRRLCRGAAVAGVALFLASGCTGDDAGAEGKVATLAGPGTPTRSAAAGVDDRRPLVRLDTSDEEREQLYRVWADCLVEKGGAKYKEFRMVIKQRGVPSDPNSPKVMAACAEKEPEEFEDRFARTDPVGFKDANRRFYRCAQEKGYKLTAPDPETGQFGLTEVGPNGDWGRRGSRAASGRRTSPRSDLPGITAVNVAP